MKIRSAFLMIYGVIFIAMGSSFANTAPYSYFDKVGNVSVSSEMAKYISVENENIEFDMLNVSLTGSINKVPDIIKNLINRGYNIQKLKSFEDKGLLGVIGYLKNGYKFFETYFGDSSIDEIWQENFNVKVKVEYTFKNNSSSDIVLDNAFSPVENTDFYNTPYYKDYVEEHTDKSMYNNKNIIRIYDDTAVPYGLVIKDGATLNNYKIEYKLDTKMFTGNNYFSGETKINFIKPVYRYSLEFKPYETKKVTFEYYTHNNEYYKSFGISYDFKPIFSWGTGLVKSLNVSIRYPYYYYLNDAPQNDDAIKMSLDTVNTHIIDVGSGFMSVFNYNNITFSKLWDKIDFNFNFLDSANADRKISELKDGKISCESSECVDFNPNILPDNIRCDFEESNNFKEFIKNQSDLYYYTKGTSGNNTLFIYDSNEKKYKKFNYSCKYGLSSENADTLKKGEISCNNSFCFADYNTVGSIRCEFKNKNDFLKFINDKLLFYYYTKYRVNDIGGENKLVIYNDSEKYKKEFPYLCK